MNLDELCVLIEKEIVSAELAYAGGINKLTQNYLAGKVDGLNYILSLIKKDKTIDK